jgi:hypothetical protein
VDQPSLLLPAWVAENAQREQMAETVDSRMRGVVGFAKLLKEYDENLSLVLVSENADYPGLVPGCLHIKRSNPGSIDYYMPLTTKAGGFREPVSTDIDRLAHRDLWRQGRLSDHLDRHRQREERQAKRDALWHEQARDELAENYRAAERVAGRGGLTKRKWAKK